VLGFDPISQHPISDISPLERITGTIYVTDSDDTATITGAVAVIGSISDTDGTDTAYISGANRADGYILATDGTDTATLTGASTISGSISVTDENDTANLVGATSISGTIDVTDEDDTANIIGSVVPFPDTIDMHDGFTKEEVKRMKKLQKKLAQAEAAKIQARLDKQLLRKQQIRDLVDPKPVQVNSPKVESVSEVKIDKPSTDLKKLNATIINLQRQQEQLLKTVELRNQIAQAQAMLAIHEAQMAAERDDEEALLLLI